MGRLIPLNNRSRNIFFIVFSVVIIAIFGYVMFHQLKIGDYPQHIEWAREYAEKGYLYKLPHTLFSKLVVIIRALLPANILVRVSVFAKQVYDIKSYEISALILMVFSYLATAFILLKRLLREWSELKIKNLRWITGLTALVILLVGPVFLFTFPDRMYLGYIVPNPYHNPTYVLFRPFVLLIFFGITDNLFARWSWRQSFVMVFLIVCASLAKPSFNLTILPAIGLLILVFYKNKLQNINWLFLFGPVGVTTLVVLASQYIINYSGNRGDQIIFAPFKAVLTQVPNVPSALLFAFLSILFPLLVAILYWKKISIRISFQLAWANFLVSAFYGYFIAEKINLSSNNFWWGLMIGSFILFVDSIIFWGNELCENGINIGFRSWKTIILASTLMMHLVCGIVYYFITLQSPVGLVV